MNIRPLIPTDAERIAAIHADALAGDFLPSLGQNFLSELYGAILEIGLGFGFAATVGNQTVGFVLASENTSALFRQAVMRRGPRLMLALLPPLLRHPLLLAKVIETFAYPEREGSATPAAELVVIAVAGDRRDRGVGTALCAHLEAEFRRRGVTRYKVTVNQSNEGANRFYQRLGCVLGHSFRLYGRAWNLYVKEL